MVTKVLVTDLNGHRNNVQAAALMATALNRNYSRKELEVVGNYVNDDYNCAIVWNADLKNDYSAEAKLEEIKKRCKKILYMYVDRNLPFPDSDVTCISQFLDLGDYYFPVSQLAIYHDLWNTPLKVNKVFDCFYGGTYKERRNYDVLDEILDDGTLLLCGDSIQWDGIAHSKNLHRLPTIRDMRLLYHTMAMCKNTIIVDDADENTTNIPTRFYEAVFTDMTCHRYNVSKDEYVEYTPEQIRATVHKPEFERRLKDMVKYHLQGE